MDSHNNILCRIMQVQCLGLELVLNVGYSCLYYTGRIWDGEIDGEIIILFSSI